MTIVRAAAHVHSEWSYDASWPLPAIADAFAARGYDVVLMAEHERGFDEARWSDYRAACEEASSERIVLVPGIEYEDSDNVVHIPVWGEAVPFLGLGRLTLELLEAARGEGAFTVLAHPWRRNAASRFRPEWAPLLDAVEIWNRQYDGIAPNPGGRALAEREHLSPFVSLDFHTSRQLFPLAMKLELEGPPTPGSVFAALRAGRFQPELRGMPAHRFTRGVPGAMLRMAEFGRRRLRKPARSLQRRLGRVD